ncbi:Ig-like domain-containing protein [Pontibacter burrus]|uniref:Ig-like domain-containing protein n=1 Tax=Pontibacter burrus TaxID=2704466 RepID=UPI0013D6ED9A|nr:Ig-like domain-containing protein [Pontibacter burrus]
MNSVINLQVDLPSNHADNRQWQVSNAQNGPYTNIAGATGLAYSFTTTSEHHNKYFRVLFTNAGGNQPNSSEAFRILLQSVPAVPTVKDGVTQGIGSVTLTASAPANHTFRWYAVKAGGIPIDGATSSTFTTPPISTNTFYYVSAVSPAGCEGPRAQVEAKVEGVSFTTLKHIGLISSNDPAMPINSLQPIAPETAADIERYKILTIPDPVQGRLYMRGNEVLKGQEISPADAAQLSFDPELSFYGNATFTYQTINKGGTASSSVVLYIIPINGAPIARNVTSNLISSGKSYSLLPFPLNAVDFDGTIERYTITSLPSTGWLSANASGSPVLGVGSVVNTSQLYYNPNQSGKGAIRTSFTYTVTDNKGVTSGTANYFLNIEVVPVNQIPVIESKTIPAVSNAAQQHVNLPPLAGTDVDGYITAYQIDQVSPTQAGTLYLNGKAITGNNTYQTESGILNGLSFLPASNYSGNVLITFRAIDNNGASSNAGTYIIPVAAPPTVTDVSFTIDPDNKNAQLLAPLLASDPDGSISSFTILSVPRGSQGRLTLNGSSVVPGQVLTPAQAELLHFEMFDTYVSPAFFTYTATDNYGIKALTNATYTILSGAIIPLPITLVSFSARAVNDGAFLTWTTATELNNDYFVIEKSADGKSFEEIGRVKGAGNSSVKLSYSYHDARFKESKSYYRLKQVDYDGTYIYSKTVALKNRNFNYNTSIQAYPNPVKTDAVAHITAPATTQATLALYCMQGRILKTETITLDEGLNTYSLPMSNLESGVYLLRVTSPETNHTTRILKD